MAIQVAKEQRVTRTGTHLVVRRLSRRRRGGGSGQDRVDHDVDRNDVDDPVGRCREIRELAATEGQNDRLGHLEAFDPAGMRPGQRTFDDRGPHYADGQRTRVLLEVALPERFGHRVAVGPAEAAGALPTGSDQLLAYPLLAQALGFHRDRRQPGPADFCGGLLVESGESIGSSGGVFGALANALRRRLLGLPVARVGHGSLGDESGAQPGDIGG